MIPASVVCVAFTCLVMMFTPSIVIRPVLGNTCSTRPRLPLSSPESTWTLSPLVIAIFTRTGAWCRIRLAFL